LNKKWRAASKSDLVLLPSGCKIRDSFIGSGQGLWMHLDPVVLEGDRQVAAFVQRPQVDSSWNSDQLSRAVVSELRKECVQGFPRGPLFLEHAATIFISRLAYSFRDNDKPQFNSARALDDVKLRRVIDYCQSNLHRNVTLSELSALVDLTPGHFCAAFKRATGQRPHQFQIERRVERAKALLRDSDKSIADIALAVGFGSQSHLYIYFNRMTGFTPARYRRDLRE
jgi:AraC family transcriptional regulator